MPDHPDGTHVRAAAWTLDAAKRRRPWSDVVATFPTLADAEADAFERECAAWSAPGFNPFASDAGCLFYLTSLPADVLRDWLLDHGVDPPGAFDAWPAWHARTCPDPLVMLTALDKLRLFDVAEAWPAAHVVATPPDRWWRYEAKPGVIAEPLRAFADATSAVRYAAGAFADMTRGARDAYYTDERDFVCTVTVDARSALFADRAFLLSHANPNGDAMYDSDWPAERPGPRYPVALFADRVAADAAVARLNALARRTLNPFAVLATTPADPGAFMDALHVADVAVTYRRPWEHFGGDWAAWLDVEQSQLTDADRAVIWAQFADAPLYTVTEVDYDGGDT